MRLRLSCSAAAAILALAMILGTATPVAAQDTIYLVRHAERLDDTEDPPLSPAGIQRAARLAELLKDAGVTAVFATQYRRTADTGRPLAGRLNIPLKIVTAGRHQELLTQVKALGPQARVLIVGHSDTVPELLAALGYSEPVTIAKAEYDNLFVVVFRPPAGPAVLRLRF